MHYTGTITLDEIFQAGVEAGKVQGDREGYERGHKEGVLYGHKQGIEQAMER